MLDGKHLLECAADICRTSVALVNEARAIRQAAKAARERSHRFVETLQAVAAPATAETRESGVLDGRNEIA